MDGRAAAKITGASARIRTSYIRRVDEQLLADVKRWRTPPADGDRVCKLQLVIRTGADGMTSDPLVCTIDGHDYDLTELWTGGAGRLFGMRNRPYDFDAYDLTPELFRARPGGLLLRELLGTQYRIRRTEQRTWFGREWQVESVAVFVNDQLLGAQMLNRTITFADTLTGTFQRGV